MCRATATEEAPGSGALLTVRPLYAILGRFFGLFFFFKFPSVLTN